jgi:pSer/pThr/pTyr-binding forkhead associated (FHA) protein
MIDTDDIKIGRGHDTDMRVTDISVSRLHALIRKSQKGYYYIEDNHSKFGTLALVKSPVQMNPQEINYI